jgi:septum formation protein
MRDIEIVLASASATRRTLLAEAGVPAICDAADVDEGRVKRDLARTGATPDHVALALAEEKARRVATRHPEALVIGADQMLDCDGVWYDKPEDRAAARAQLIQLRGRTHRLVSAATVVRGDRVLWRHASSAHLSMRDFSEPFLDAYLDRAGDSVLGSVGAYRLEGLGAQLFATIAGDHFTILGLPLLPLLAFLRDRGVLLS